jgi:hypothetical protein
MDAELTLEQAREINLLRRRHPGATLRVHERSWGVLVEVVRGTHTVRVERFDFGGATVHDAPITLAA